MSGDLEELLREAAVKRVRAADAWAELSGLQNEAGTAFRAAWEAYCAGPGAGGMSAFVRRVEEYEARVREDIAAEEVNRNARARAEARYGALESAGECLHRLLYAYWGEHPRFGVDGDWASLSNGAMAGWQEVATRLIAAQEAGGGRGE